MTEPVVAPATPEVANLRVRRDWVWTPVPGVKLRMGGGPAPLQLEAIDVLETLVEGQWVAVPVVEMPKPEHPDAAAARRRSEEMAAQMAELMKDVVVLKPGESPFKRGVLRQRKG